MSSNVEKPIIGAQVLSPHLHSHSTNLPIPNSPFNGSSTSSLITNDQGVTPLEEYDSNSQHPFSAFYSHPTTRTSFEQHKSESKSHIKVYEQDLEAGSQTFSSSDIPRPTKEYLGTETRKGAKKNLCTQQNNGWSPLRRLNKKQRLSVKILICLVVVGAAVGIGIGISRAVGAGVWKNNNSQTKIPG